MSDNKQVELVVVRHGKSTGNEKRQLQGHVDTALSEEGREQARLVGERMAGTEFHLCLSSDLQRAAHTAAAIQQRCPASPAVQHWQLLRERNFGELSSRQYDGLKEEDYEAPPGGETREALGVRVAAALTAVCKEAAMLEVGITKFILKQKMVCKLYGNLSLLVVWDTCISTKAPTTTISLVPGEWAIKTTWLQTTMGANTAFP